ncbi:MAG: hypothetical protein JW787_09960 [Sedimentisphaerales bacterium]|nr:hypothetical protein [Sedimentisphaerales bacterium]
MNENKLKNLLCNADHDAGKPCPVKVDISAITRRAQRRRIYKIAYPAAAAAVLIFGISFWSLFCKNAEPVKEPIQLANNIEIKIKQLHESTDNVLNLIQEIRKQEQGQKRLNELEAELAAIPDPIKQVNEELDKTAFTLVYAADKMYKELNLTDSAVETYKRVIKLFPDNQWAEVARERLEEIKNRRNNNDSSKGESKWQQQNTLS